MSRVMMWCANKNRPTFTGLELPHGSSLKGYVHRKFACERCNHEHLVRNPWFEEDGPSPVDAYFVALDGAPEIAAEIGIMMSMLAIVESGFPHALHRLTSLSVGDATVIMNFFRSFSDKTELLKLIVANRDPSTPDKPRGSEISELPSLISTVNAANTIRNKYAHAMYGVTVKRGALVMPYRSDIRKKSVPGVEMALEEIVEDVRKVRAAAVAMHAYAHGYKR
jgi:hypothetical protein